ncbi:MAG: sugar ABC transporter permease [Actinomycetota bacterium]|nr:sugar ABC transporter permease [Actinomycetota bacterium]
MKAKQTTFRAFLQDVRTGSAPFGYLLVAPLVLWLVITIVIPLIYAVYVGFTDAGIIGTEADFIGLENYVGAVRDAEFRSAFGKSLIWAVGGAALQTVLAFTTALALNQAFRGRRFARTWIILSWIIPTIVIAILWRWMLNASYGILNFLVTTLGISDAPIDFLGSPKWALPTVIAINAWRWFPFLALLILAGLQSIPGELYEAAKVDGANATQRFFSITMPQLQPVLYVVGLIGTLWAFQIFDVIWLLTQGGPAGSTQTLPVLIYDRAFNGFAMGEASAISVLLCAFLLIFSVLYIKFVPAGESDTEVF